MSATRYPGLDGLRGLAAFAVILHHSAIKGTDIGGLSVFVFFILSGFLITGILIRARRAIEMGQTSGRAALIRFWTQRALRIFPAYYFWLLVFLPFDALLFDGQTLAHLPWYLLYAQNFLIAFVTFAWQDFTHTWSLAVEQQYYVFFAPLVLAVPSREQNVFFITTIGLCLFVIVALAASGYEIITLYPEPSTGFVFMATGALLAIAEPSRLAIFSKAPVVSSALTTTVLLALYPIADRAHVLHIPYVLLVSASAAALGALFAAVLAAPRGWPVRLLDMRVPRFLGDISYALYIVHLPLSYWAHEKSSLSFLGAPTGFLRDLVEFALVAPASLALATFSYYWIERPFLRLKARLKEKAVAPAPIRENRGAPVI